jgi:hypothetical protein
MNEGMLACRARGIKLLIIDVPSIDEALMATVEGRSVNLLKRAYSPGL